MKFFQTSYICDRCQKDIVIDNVIYYKYNINHSLDLYRYDGKIGKAQRRSILCSECSKKLAHFINGAKLENELNTLSPKEVYYDFEKIY